jgi:hypothetical protein
VDYALNDIVCRVSYKLTLYAIFSLDVTPPPTATAGTKSYRPPGAVQLPGLGGALGIRLPGFGPGDQDARVRLVSTKPLNTDYGAAVLPGLASASPGKFATITILLTFSYPMFLKLLATLRIY